MKQVILVPVWLLIMGMLQSIHAQIIQETPVAITAIDRSMVERSGNLHFDLLANLPIGKGGENFSLGAGARVQYDFGRNRIIRGNTDFKSESISSPFIIGREEMGMSALELAQMDSSTALIDANQIRAIEVARSGFLAELGYQVLIGKTETYTGGSFKYENLSIVHGFAGYHVMPCPQGDIELEAGPALGLFKGGGSEFGYGAALNGYYDFSKPIVPIRRLVLEGERSLNWSVGGGISYYKLGQADGILTFNAGIRASF